MTRKSVFHKQHRKTSDLLIGSKSHRKSGATRAGHAVYGSKRSQINTGRIYGPVTERRPFLSRFSPRTLIIGFLVVIVLVVGSAILGISALQVPKVNITINGQTANVNYNSTATDLINIGKIKTQAGDFVAVDNSVIESGGGQAYSISVNDKTYDEMPELQSDDRVIIGRGANIEEPASNLTETEIAFDIEVSGTGAIGTWVNRGTPGVHTVKTGQMSGKQFDGVTREPVKAQVLYYNPSPATKLLALTFDDGPWSSTPDILDVLDEFGAKATFFNIGVALPPWGDYEVMTAERGHQVGTHTQNHKYLTGLSAKQVANEWKVSEENIFEQSGVHTKVGRAPGGIFNENCWKASYDYLDTLVGWTIDPADWNANSTVGSIAETLVENAYNGGIAVMHDGGADRSKTVEALRIALPQLIEEGYQFVTIDELMKQSPPVS